MRERRPVSYAIGSTLGGPGIGTIAGHAVEGGARNGLLDRAYAWAAADLDVPAERIATLPFGRAADALLHHYRNDFPFDVVSKRWIDETELFHGWNNMCLRTLRAVNERDGVTVVERASAHPAVQSEIVEREFREYGVDEQFIDSQTYRRANAELDEADAVFVPSQFVYDSFLEEGFDESALVKIPYGVDPERFDLAENAGDVDETEFVAIFVGHVSLRKGVQYLFPAWKRAGVEGTLRIAGEVRGVADEVVEPYREEESIEFLGFVDDVEREFQRADVFVFPTIEDGFGLVVLEAMATGTPVITTANAGASELISEGEDGFVVEPRDVDGIAGRLETLAADPERRQDMGERAREKAEAYTWRRYGDKLAEAYLDLLEESRPG